MSKDKKFICVNLETRGTRIVNNERGLFILPNHFCCITNMNLNNVQCGICNHFNLSQIQKPNEEIKTEKINENVLLIQ